MSTIFGATPFEEAVINGDIVVEHIVDGDEFTEGIDTHGIDVGASHSDFCFQVGEELSEMLGHRIIYCQSLYPNMYYGKHVIFERGQVVTVGKQADDLREQFIKNIPIVIARVESRDNYWHTWAEGDNDE